LNQIKTVYEEVEYFVQNQIEAIKTNLSVAEKLKKIEKINTTDTSSLIRMTNHPENDSSVIPVCHADASCDSYSVAVEAEVSRTAELMESRFNFEIGKCYF